MNTDDLNKLTSLYGSEVYSFCFYLARCKYDADELYQDTFLKLYEMRDKINTDCNIKSYILGIAVRLWKNKRRKWAWRKRIAPTENIDNLEGIVCLEASPDKELIAADDRNLVRLAVNSLNDRMRIPILLYYSMDMSVESIAETLKIPQGTVKSRLYNARKILKEKLEADIYG